MASISPRVLGGARGADGVLSALSGRSLLCLSSLRASSPYTLSAGCVAAPASPMASSRAMSTLTYAMAAPSPGAPLELIAYNTPQHIPEGQVRVSVTHCGQCHSDLHKIDDSWRGSGFPIVAGHEVVGVVEECGKGVTTLEPGMRVGFGPQRESCGECNWCLEGEGQLCHDVTGLYDPHFGGYSTSIVAPESYAFEIPDALESSQAAPLLCAGITTYAPLQRFVKEGDRVGIIGVGGLGHMGLQYSKAMGCETIAISRTTAKEEEAKQFGASHVLASTDKADMKDASGSFDFLLCTASDSFSLRQYLRLLKPRGTLCLVGLPPVDKPLDLLPQDLLFKELNLVGSFIGGGRAMADMLQFSADHSCVPLIEVIPMMEAQTGLNRLEENSVRYRMVLEMGSFTKPDDVPVGEFFDTDCNPLQRERYS